MKPVALLVGALGGVLTVALLASVPPDDGGRAGQTVFVPAESLPRGVALDDPQALEITACEDTAEGLVVRGRITPVSGIHNVRVTGGLRRGPGVRVGSASLADVDGRFEWGEFRVVLPWADSTSRFALIFDGGHRESRRGPVARCRWAEGAEKLE